MIDLAPYTDGPRERLLAALIEARGAHVAHAALAERVGVEPLRLARLLAGLGEEGVSFETMPGRGYRLAAPLAPLDPERVERAAAGARRFGRALCLAAVTSTNDVAVALGEAGEADGAVVVAESQTRGRGRAGRAWISPPGIGLWCSILLRPRVAADAVHLLTPAAALAASRAAREVADIPLFVKWPNDLVARAARAAGAAALAPAASHGPASAASAAWLKVGGILSEGRTTGGRLDFAVIGMGLNVGPLPEPAPPGIAARATSLAALAGRPVAREDLLAALLRALDPLLATVEADGLAPLLSELRALSPLIGRRVSVATGGRVVAGVARDLDAAGALVVAADSGGIERVVAGDAHIQEDA